MGGSSNEEGAEKQEGKQMVKRSRSSGNDVLRKTKEEEKSASTSTL